MLFDIPLRECAASLGVKVMDGVEPVTAIVQ
jgi:hypothetical protein